jgi:RNA polymerase sigma-70 factor (ECF subfamily)
MERAPCADSRTSPPALTDLVLRGRGGDRAALKLLIERYQGRIASFVLAETRDANAYEDLCQAVFVKMVLALPRLREPARFEGWLFQIARNVTRDHRRAAVGWRRYFVAWQPEYDAVAAPAEPAAAERESALKHGLKQLSAEDRALLRLHVEESVSCQDLARASNSTVSAIKSRLYRARRELRGILLAGDPE